MLLDLIRDERRMLPVVLRTKTSRDDSILTSVEEFIFVGNIFIIFWHKDIRKGRAYGSLSTSPAGPSVYTASSLVSGFLVCGP
jgi:hypothetical protein